MARSSPCAGLLAAALLALAAAPGATRVRLIWRQRVWRCDDPDCMRRTFVEQVPTLVAARGSITMRAVTWAIGQLRREHATIAGLARQLGTSWKTVWRAVEPELVRLAADESRFTGVTSLGVDEHVWHHVDTRPPARGGRGRGRGRRSSPGTREGPR